MKNPKPKPLARRERQIMDVLYKLERATVGQVLAALPDQLNYSTVRAQLRVLEEKGHLRHEEHGLKYVYFPAIPRDVARRSALRHVVETFFDGSVENVVAALLGGEVSQISWEELDRLARLIPKAGLSQKGAPPNSRNKGPKIDLKKKDLRKNERTF
jgi:BlaI family transcriptional regulator, penicillinase repressor